MELTTVEPSLAKGSLPFSHISHCAPFIPVHLWLTPSCQYAPFSVGTPYSLFPLLGTLGPPVPIKLAITTPRSHLPVFKYEALPIHLTKYNVILQAEDQTVHLCFLPLPFLHYVPSVVPRVNCQLDRIYNHLGEGLLGIAVRD